MYPVSYTHSFEYSYDAEGHLRPLLRFTVTNRTDPSMGIEIEAAIDCGAERSLLNGKIGLALGLDILSGTEIIFSTMAGGLIPSRLHPVRLSHEDLGTFELDIAFSSGEIGRNLLGRDFFDLAQIGFREHHLSFFVTPTP